MIEIPVFQRQSADFTQNIDLDEINVTIRLTYNVRNEYFHIDLITDNFDIQGIKVVKNFPLLFTHKAIFPEMKGDFMIRRISESIDVEEFNYDNLGIFWSLFYLNESELNEWKEENGL